MRTPPRSAEAAIPKAPQSIRIGERNLRFELSGSANASPSVILLGGGGGTIATWTAIQTAVAEFAPALSYDRAGLGESDPAPAPQSLDEMLTDILILIAEVGLRPPFILVGASVGGLHARKLALQFPNDVAGIVLVDSSHDEQVWRINDFCPQILDLEYGPGWRDDDAMRRLGWLVGGERSKWRLDVPLIAIEHMRSGRTNPFPGLPEEMFQEFEKVWHAMQQDLASWSPRGELREATRSGHGIPASEPEFIVKAIADLVSISPQTNRR